MARKSPPSNPSMPSAPSTIASLNATANQPKEKYVKHPQKKSVIRNLFSLSSLSSFAALYYVYFAFSNLKNLMYPLGNISKEDLKNIPKERMVFPFWSWGGGGGSRNNIGVLGMRVYLSTKREFSLDYFSVNDEFGTSDDNGRNYKSTTIRDGESFLLWSEDNALEATKTFPSRSFVLVASDYPSCDAKDDNAQVCRDGQQQKSFDYAHKWLEDSIQHEKQLQSDGGGIMAAMNSAGGGIESTSVLFTFYTSLHRNLKHLMEAVIQLFTRGSGGEQKEMPEKLSDGEEPKSIIYISHNNPIWKSIMSNGTAYVHVLLIRQTPSADGLRLISSSLDSRSAAMRLQQLHSQHNVVFGNVAMMKRELPIHVPSPKRVLYRDVLFILKKYGVCRLRYDSSCSSMVAPWNSAYHQQQETQDYLLARTHRKQGVKYPYWKPEVMIHLIQDDEGYPLDYANRIGFEIIQLGRGQQQRGREHPSGYSYLPAVHVDEIGLTSDKYIPLNETVLALPLRIGFHSDMMISEKSSKRGLSPARYRLLNHLSSALESQRELGFEQSDIDDLRRLIAETNVMLLAITILASVLHLLFEFLTFKSDVDFWRGNTDLTGLSVRALFLDWMSQVVILFYLIEMDSSLLMTLPTAVGMLIALWKCQRGAGFAFVKSPEIKNKKAWYNKIFGVLGYELCATRLRAAAVSSDKLSEASVANKPDLAALTEEMDQLATKLLGKFLLLPLVLTYATYSLVKEQHSGWYSWFITTASSFVYAIGFVLMTPQLFLNYKLKSVAHLPWRVLGYRFVNTFIDDLFAFIIRMPTMARVSCFRDDVVFIVYLWQRYLYPVDSSRPVEGGVVGDVTHMRVEDGSDTKGK
ncbi:hypothetical protein ACHAXA_002622 [Cyclostephanos tholiformis]|uniref:Uncharacterized protein n=1 Tax=Cyclostephanos tholiformis TaxID=382380 RepID=A0ABD3SDA9_9STRA